MSMESSLEVFSAGADSSTANTSRDLHGPRLTPLSLRTLRRRCYLVAVAGRLGLAAAVAERVVIEEVVGELDIEGPPRRQPHGHGARQLVEVNVALGAGHLKAESELALLLSDLVGPLASLDLFEATAKSAPRLPPTRACRAVLTRWPS